MKNLIDLASNVVCMDVDALFYQYHRFLTLSTRKFSVSPLFSHVICSTTASLRFLSENNSDLQSLHSFMVPYHPHHFLTPSLNHISRYINKHPLVGETHVTESLNQIFRNENMMVSLNLNQGQCTRAAACYRGHVNPSDFDLEILAIAYRELGFNKESFRYNHVPHCSYNHRLLQGSLLMNTTAITSLFSRLEDKFSASFAKKEHLERYLTEGMEEFEFIEAQEKLLNLIAGY
jgi:hypothetical protein